MFDREKINQAFDNDPHQKSEIANRIQCTKLQLDLQSKADRGDLEALNMQKCDKREMNVLGEKFG
jgi:hypothetical protein